MICIGIDQTWQLSTGLLHCQNDSVSNGSPAVEDGGMCSSWEKGNGKLSTFRSWSRLSLCLNLVILECCKLWSRLSSNLSDVWCTEEDKSLCSLPRIRSEALLPSVSWSLFKSRIWCRIKQVLLCSWPSWDICKIEDANWEDMVQTSMGIFTQALDTV